MALKKSELYSSLWSTCDELRGGMDASQYKDYVLVLLFIKYVSDKYAGQPFAPITIPARVVPSFNPGQAFKEAVAEKKVYSDGTRTVEIYHVSPVPHSNGLMIAYIPKEKILFQGDFSLPAPGQPANDDAVGSRWVVCR